MSPPVTENTNASPEVSRADVGVSAPKMLLADTQLLNWSSIVFAIVQSACTAVIAISGLRVAIGLTPLAPAAGIHAPPRVFHQDPIRIPLLASSFPAPASNPFSLFKV